MTVTAARPADAPANQQETDAPTTRTIAHEKAAKKFDLSRALTVASGEHDRGFGDLVRDIVRVAFGRGKLKPEEFFFFRLFEGGRTPEQLSEFVGRRTEVRTNFACNYDRRWFAIAEDKLLYQSTLGGMGLPVPELVAVYHAHRKHAGAAVFHHSDQVAAFLRESGDYPLFGKPNSTRWSVGAASLDGYARERDCVAPLFGDAVPVADFVREIERYADSGYLFQKRLDPHPRLAALSGPALPTVRVLCVQDERGPKILRTHIKLPAGANIADNTWRSGNLIAAVDTDSGEMQRALLGTGIDAIEVCEHPDSGGQIVGTTLPHWPVLREVVCEATASLPGFRLVGWDVAICEQGPVLVEVNVDPDWAMNQLVSGKGMWTSDFAAFVDGCRTAAERDKERLRKSGA
jgi:hypothetical protein